MVQGKIGKEGGREGTGDFRKKISCRLILRGKSNKEKFGAGGGEYPALKKTLAPLYVGETIISLAISRGLEKKTFLPKPSHLYPPQKSNSRPLKNL